MPGSTRESVSAEPAPLTPAAAASAAAEIVEAPQLPLARRMAAQRGAVIGGGIVLAMALLAALAPWIAAHDPYAQDLARRLLPPVWEALGSWTHPLGTDHLGRDYLARLLYGARVSLLIGFAAASIGCLIGGTLGFCAGYFGGRVDQAACYLLTCQLALPTLLLAMALVFLIGPSLFVVIVVIGLLHWSYFLVVVRAMTQQLKQLDFVAAARAAGASSRQIIWYELLPNVRGSIVVVFTLEVGVAVLAEASLSFLGVGVPAPTPTWGLMIAEGRTAVFLRPWLVVVPGVALFLLVVSVNLLGDALRAATAPEAHR
jgi:peptide/nickel transport system permease protein